MTIEEEFHKRWAGRKFVCMDTNDVFVIPDDVQMGNFFRIGNGYIDVGDEFFYRTGGNLKELGDQNEME